MFLRDITRVYVIGTIVCAVVVLVGWGWFVDRMSIGHSVPLWRRLWLPRSAIVAGGSLEVPASLAVASIGRRVRVIYRLPPLTQAQATFIVQVQPYKDSTALPHPAPHLKTCDTLPTACTSWFADGARGQVPCLEARLGVSKGDDLGSIGVCRPSLGPVHGIYGCMGAYCASARRIVNHYFMTQSKSGVVQGGG
jgi:hypothetical protein